MTNRVLPVKVKQWCHRQAALALENQEGHIIHVQINTQTE
jgi:hypothetical protein